MSVCTVIVLSKPGARRAQLDLLLRSLDRYWPNQDVQLLDAPLGQEFDRQLDALLMQAREFVCFVTDDSVLYRPVFHPEFHLLDDERVLCHSLRLGANTVRCYPTGQRQKVPSPIWSWVEEAENGDFGYPGSVDAHLFRRADLLELLTLDGKPYVFVGPNYLETFLNDRCWSLFHERRPLMSRPPLSCYVSVPVNRVSEQSGVHNGSLYPQSTELLDGLYDTGSRIRLDSIYPQLIDAAHVELPFQWGPAKKLRFACG